MYVHTSGLYIYVVGMSMYVFTFVCTYISNCVIVMYMYICVF